MSLKLPAGHRYLRLTALTPANCGHTGGSAAVDRPVAVDVCSGLPYLPHSALKGVLAGRWGNVYRNGALNTARTKLFGAPDENDDGTGRAGDLVFGDAEALAFPLLLRDGRRALVAVAPTLWKLARHGLLPAISLRPVAEEKAWEGAVSPADLPLLSERLVTDRFGFDLATLAAWLGFSGPVIVAASEAASELWQAAHEERTLTALGNGRTVRAGSLRTIELIPAGTHFVSLVSNLSKKEVDLGAASPLQLGAWEATGCGYFSAALLPELPPESAPDGEKRRFDESEDTPRPRHEVMRKVFLALQALKPETVRKRARSAIYDLGPRLAQRGLAVTLAFCLAKAGGGEDAEDLEDRIRAERDAYRFILGELFPPERRHPEKTLHQRVVEAIEEGDSALPPDFHETRLWLRRYAETMLPKEKDGE